VFWVRSGDAERVGSGTESELIAEGMCFRLGWVLWNGLCGTESELNAEGMRVRLGWVMGSERCRERDREREIRAEWRGK